MEKKTIVLWADDEIEILRPHVMFLESRGYKLITVNNGLEAIEKSVSMPVDVVILDEHMPGISGLRTLSIIKEKSPHLPIIMLTKSEEEDIMDKAIGSKISDYLIKPVNPRQILSSLKKVTMSGRLVSEMSSNRYTEDFHEISTMIGECKTLKDWKELYERLTYWQIELNDRSASDSPDGMAEMVENQLREAEMAYFKFIRNNYRELLMGNGGLMSHNILKRRLLPLLKSGEKPWVIVIDNFRLDQWKTLSNSLSEFFRIDEEISCSILPTSTQYSRNSIFSGMMPAEIKEIYPELWTEESSEEGKNMHEERLLRSYLEREGVKADVFYTHVNDSESCHRLIRNFNDTSRKDVKAVVISFIDMMSHERTYSRTIRELSSTAAGYLSLTQSWFRHSPIGELFAKIAQSGDKIVLTTDHGTIRVSRAVKVMADRTASDTLRYKMGKSLKFDSKEVMEVSEPKTIGLPQQGMAMSYTFASGSDYFVYQNNYNKFVRLYNGTYQHGGISMQEMLVPLVVLTPK